MPGILGSKNPTKGEKYTRRGLWSVHAYLRKLVISAVIGKRAGEALCVQPCIPACVMVFQVGSGGSV